MFSLLALLILSVSLIIPGILCKRRYDFLKRSEDRETEYKSGAIIFFILGGFAIASMLLIPPTTTMFYYSEQKSNYETVRKLKKCEAIYADKANSLTAQFKAYLAETYPQHERDIFKKVTLDKPEIYLVKYPELRSVEGFMGLVGEIGKLQTDRYNQQLEREKVLKNMRFATKNPWIFYWWIPTLEELEKQYGKI